MQRIHRGWRVVLASALACVLGCDAELEPTAHGAVPAPSDRPLPVAVAPEPPPSVVPLGRSSVSEAGRTLSWAGSGVRLHARGHALELVVRRKGDTRLLVRVDDLPRDPERSRLSKRGAVQTERLRIALDPSREHEIELQKRDEPRFGEIVIEDLRVVDGELLPARHRGRLEVLGDSISVGFGDANPRPGQPCRFAASENDASLSYASLMARDLDLDLSLVAVSSKTVRQMTTLFEHAAPDKQSPAWSFPAAEQPSLLVVLLGTNDFFHRDPGEATFVHDYLALIGRLRARYGGVPIVAALSPMLSDRYPEGARHRTLGVRYLTHAVAAAHDDKLRYFELAEQRPEDGLGCSSHPSSTTHRRMADALVTWIRQENLVP